MHTAFSLGLLWHIQEMESFFTLLFYDFYFIFIEFDDSKLVLLLKYLLRGDEDRELAGAEGKSFKPMSIESIFSI